MRYINLRLTYLFTYLLTYLLPKCPIISEVGGLVDRWSTIGHPAWRNGQSVTWSWSCDSELVVVGRVVSRDSRRRLTATRQRRRTIRTYAQTDRQTDGQTDRQQEADTAKQNKKEGPVKPGTHWRQSRPNRQRYALSLRPSVCHVCVFYGNTKSILKLFSTSRQRRHSSFSIRHLLH